MINYTDYSASIECIKQQGAINALRKRIDFLIHQLAANNWRDIESNSHYFRLSEAITDGERILLEIRVMLVALQELDPDNN